VAGGDYRERLEWDVQQFNAACTGDPSGDGPGWVRDHDLCLLMTHQGPEWLSRRSREDVYREINPAGRFAVHLFGHMHENVVRGSSVGGGRTLWQWQGSSLFSLEKFGDPPQMDRRHGYSAGTIEFDGSLATLRHWPCKAVTGPNGWRFVSDVESCALKEDGGGTEPVTIPIRKREHEGRSRSHEPVDEQTASRSAASLSAAQTSSASRRLTAGIVGAALFLFLTVAVIWAALWNRRELAERQRLELAAEHEKKRWELAERQRLELAAEHDTITGMLRPRLVNSVTELKNAKWAMDLVLTHIHQGKCSPRVHLHNVTDALKIINTEYLNFDANPMKRLRTEFDKAAEPLTRDQTIKIYEYLNAHPQLEQWLEANVETPRWTPPRGWRR
jgi:hypothetical protein